ncbi:MAG: carboxymuconolactone decarboxylase family protein [Weeksellaceae bacterium]
MTRINLSQNGTTPFEKLIGHNAKILKKWNELDETLWSESSLDHNLLEQVRRTTAFENGCEYCMVKGGSPNFDKSEVKTSVITAFAELFCKDHHSLTDEHFSMLKKYLSDKEIAELCVFVAFITASQKIGKIFNLTEDLQENATIKLSELE